MGLLNCPYEGGKNQDTYWQTGADSNYKVFNNTKLYSAFQYLRSRNEDTRAKYLYYFVNGLYEIQHDYPFIFKKISGINELEKYHIEPLITICHDQIPAYLADHFDGWSSRKTIDAYFLLCNKDIFHPYIL